MCGEKASSLQITGMQDQNLAVQEREDFLERMDLVFYAKEVLEAAAFEKAVMHF